MSALEILGQGVYTPQEAARLIGTSTQNVIRWTRGSGPAEPLWQNYYFKLDETNELSFRDLAELKIVKALRKAGLSLQKIRYAIKLAEEKFKTSFPLSHKNFRTDGSEIFISIYGEKDLTSLSKQRGPQKVFERVIAPTLIDFEYGDIHPARWKPSAGRGKVVIDPQRSFGSPILSDWGISTSVLSSEFEAFKDAEYLGRIYEIPKAEVIAAVNFERSLDGQSLIR